MRAVRAAAAVAILAMFALLIPQPANAGRGFAFDDVYSHQAQSQYEAFSPANPLTKYHPKVQVKLYSKKQANGVGFVTTQINIDAWKDGKNPADVPCPDYFDDNGVQGTVYLDRFDGGQWTVVREWQVTLGNNGDGCHEELLGGTNSVSTNSTGIRARFDDYVIRIHNGGNITGKTTWVNRKSTTATGWTFACGGDNIVYCDQNGPF